MQKHIKIVLFYNSTEKLFCYPRFSLISNWNLENMYTQQAAIRIDMGEYQLLKHTFRTYIF